MLNHIIFFLLIVSVWKLVQYRYRFFFKLMVTKMWTRCEIDVLLLEAGWVHEDNSDVFYSPFKPGTSIVFDKRYGEFFHGLFVKDICIKRGDKVVKISPLKLALSLRTSWCEAEKFAYMREVFFKVNRGKILVGYKQAWGRLSPIPHHNASPTATWWAQRNVRWIGANDLDRAKEIQWLFRTESIDRLIPENLLEKYLPMLELLDGWRHEHRYSIRHLLPYVEVFWVREMLAELSSASVSEEKVSPEFRGHLKLIK